MADLSNFPDQALLYDLEYNCSSEADVPRKAILSQHHKGAFTYWNEVARQLDDEIAQGWWQGPYRFVPVFPFRAVPRNCVMQFRADGSPKPRITVDLSWPHDGSAVNAHVHLALQPKLTLARLASLAQAADILYFTGAKVSGFGVDNKAAYRQWAKREAERWQHVLLWYREKPDGSVVPEWYLDRRTTFGDAIMVRRAHTAACGLTTGRCHRYTSTVGSPT